MLPDVDPEERHVVLQPGTVLVRGRVHGEPGAVPDEPRPTGAETLDAAVVQRRAQLTDVAERVGDRVGQRSGRVAAAARLHDLPEQRVIRVAAAVVADRPLLVFGECVQDAEHLLDRLAVPLGAFEGLVEIVDVGLMVLPVMDLHRLRVDRRLERVVRVRETGELVGHASPSVWFSSGGYAPRRTRASDEERHGACLQPRGNHPPRTEAGAP